MPAALACKTAEAHGRKIVASAIINHGDVGVCIRYSCERDSLAKITKERVPKSCTHNSKAYMDYGDQIRGKNIAVYVAGRRPLRSVKVSAYSGTHSNSILETNNTTYAELTQAFENIVNSAAKQKAALPVSVPAKQLSAPKKAKGKRRR